MSELVIDHCAPADRAAMLDVVAAAFGRPEEARLVALLMERNEVLQGLVARAVGRDGADARLVGTVIVSPLRLSGADSAGPLGAVAPLAVAPDAQHRGIGSQLMWRMIGDCRAAGFASLFLLGDPDYYGRFGFRTAAVGNTYAATTAFQQLDFVEPGPSGGVAHYVAAFDEAGT